MLDTAIEAAKSGGALALSYFKNQPKVTYKPDSSPVTIADRNSEKLIKKVIFKKFPDHGFIGEEFGIEKPDAKFQWVIDPIDGTKSFVRGITGWGVLIALLVDNKPEIGVYFSPATDEIYYCQKGKGTFLNGKRTHVSKIKELDKSFIIHSSLNHFERIAKVNNLVKLASIVQGKYGASDCYGFSLMLKGQADVYAEAKGKIWDFAAPAILISEAGGKFSDFENKEKIDSGTLLLTNGILHSQVINILNN